MPRADDYTSQEALAVSGAASLRDLVESEWRHRIRADNLRAAVMRVRERHRIDGADSREYVCAVLDAAVYGAAADKRCDDCRHFDTALDTQDVLTPGAPDGAGRKD